MRTRLVIAILLSALAAYLVWSRQREKHTAPPAAARAVPASGGLDVAAFRDHLASRRAAARALAERHARAVAADAGVVAGHPSGLHLADTLVAPVCILGPVDLCASIADTVAACDRGEGQACLAVGQFLEDAPPRPLIVLTVYLAGCNAGEVAACKRMAQLKSNGPAAPCAADPMVCAWRAYRARDAVLLGEACTLGVADACAYMFGQAGLDAAHARTYLEAGCQLGNPMTCEELGRRLSPTCDHDCYPPDPAAAVAASTIACDVGLTSACAALPR